MNNTPRSNRIHIGLFGRRNVGKSSIINALTNQSISLVSDVAGTTTDPVFKSMELLPLGPVVFIDTAGIDDIGSLGEQRIQKTYEVIRKTDIDLIVFDVRQTDFSYEESLIQECNNRNKPYLLIANKIDTVGRNEIPDKIGEDVVHPVSSETTEGIEELKELIGTTLDITEDKFRIVGDLIHPGDIVVLVTPIDKAAPKGRLILPQQQVIRDVLESDAIAIVTKEYELRETLLSLAKDPALVITDSQVFLKVSADTPPHIPLTSFSILFARHKGDLMELVKGALAIDSLSPGDKILISEGCTHHRQSDDIGTVKIPRWLRQYTGHDFEFLYSSGYTFPKELDDVQLVIHCGGCMLNKKEMQHRIHEVVKKDIPIVNYGVLISYVQGIFERALQPFPIVHSIFQEDRILPKK
jgi:[FeFe] hydrogenase H-cluster maturation GTPase HydF